MNEIATSRDKIDAIEAEMLKMPQVECKVTEFFSHLIYARQIEIPAGVTLTGKIHKFENFNILSKGEMIVSTDEGMVRVQAPFAIVSPPGTKRIAYALTDCVWTTIHGTELKDPNLIELKFIAQSEVEYLEFCKTLQLGSN